MNKHYLKRLLAIAVPIMLGNVISQLQMIIDRIFLGHVNTLYMSALGNVNSSMWTTMSVCFSIVTGSSILISQNVGAGDREKVESYAASMVKWNNIGPIALFLFWLFCGEFVFKAMGVSENVMPMCLTYAKWFAPVFLLVGIEGSFSVIMQTSNYTQPMIFYSIIRSGLNIFLDWVMIFGKLGCPAMGIEGAAIATTISEFAGCVFAMLVFLTKDLDTKPSVKGIIFAPIKPYLNSIKLGINVALEDFAWNLGNLVIIRILNSINEIAAGIYSIVFSVEVLVVVIFASIGSGTLTLTGEAKGKKDKTQFVQIVKIAYLLSAFFAVIMLVICASSPKAILSLFTTDDSIISGCGIYLILVCLNMYGKSGNIIIGNGIRGYGDTKWMFNTQILGTIMVVSFAALFVYVFHFGIIGVFFAVMLDELIRAFINLGKLVRITRLFDSEVG